MTDTITINSKSTLTRLHLNPRHRQASLDLSDINRMHQRVMGLFPELTDPRPRSAANVLYRVERNRTAMIVLVQSAFHPDITRLPVGYGTVDSTTLAPLLDRLDYGTTVRYRIVANPVAIHTSSNGKKSRRWLRGQDAVLWWQRRAAEAGLDTHSTLLAQETLLTGYRESFQGRQQILHGATQFEGTAAITDPDAARNAVLIGIGKARSYGCGLLSLATISR